MAKRIILGSNSPRRRELLAGLGLEFTVDTGNTFEEAPVPGEPAHEVPLRLSAGKSHGFHRPLEPDEVLITSDTVVIVDGEVLGKPHSREDAVRMLRLLSGRAHEVVTAVTIRDASYPQRLRSVDDAPVVLYYQGRLPQFELMPAIAMVGTRRPSGYGFMKARQFGTWLGEYGVIVVSGGAAGVDTECLSGALEADAPVVAVLLCALAIPETVFAIRDLRLNLCALSCVVILCLLWCCAWRFST